MAAIERKLLIVGDSGSGKTSLLVVASRDSFPDFSEPFQDYELDIFVGSKQVKFQLCDSPGLEDYDLIRTLSYPDTDVIVIIFGIDCPVSLENVLKKWTPEVRKYCPNIPIVLVGNKKELRKDAETVKRLADVERAPLTYEEGQAMAEKIQAVCYLECSAKLKEGVRKVFEVAARASLREKE